jgi:predicted metalloendopeptidase
MERWEEFCYKYVDSSLPWMASHFFVDKAYDQDKREFADTMTKDLKSAYLERTNSWDWIANNNTRKLVQEKISDIVFKIGYPDHVSERGRRKFLDTADLAS